MTEQKIKDLFNDKIAELLEDINFYEKSGTPDLVRETIEGLKQIIWLAHDFGVLTFGEWEVMNSKLIDRYFKTY